MFKLAVRLPENEYGLGLFFCNTLRLQCPDLAHAPRNFFYLFLMDQFLNPEADQSLLLR